MEGVANQRGQEGRERGGPMRAGKLDGKPVDLITIFEGVAQPSGYTEPLLHKYRQAKKAG